jgi:hypothetical protein
MLLFHGTADAKDFQIGFFHIDYLGDGYTDLKPRSDYDIRTAAQLIAFLDIEVLGLVGIENEYALTRLVEQIKEFEDPATIFDYGIATSGGVRKCGIVYKKNQVELVNPPRDIDEIQEELSEEQKLFERLPLYAYIRIEEFDFHFVVLHLKEAFDFNAIKRREKQLDRLRAWLAEQVEADPDVVIVGGFEDRLQSSPLSKFNSANQFFFCTSELPQCEYTHIGNKSLIDHITVSKIHDGAIEEYERGSITVFPSESVLRHLYGSVKKLRERLSGHRLIFATFETP